MEKRSEDRAENILWVRFVNFSFIETYVLQLDKFEVKLAIESDSTFISILSFSYDLTTMPFILNNYNITRRDNVKLNIILVHDYF